MTARPRDWSPVGLGSDPTPGDPVAVTRAGKHYTSVAEAIRTAATNLRDIADGPEMKSQAVEVFVSTTREVAEDIEKAHERYAGVGDALTDYAPELQAAQDDADAALRRASIAQDDLHTAQLRLSSAQDDLSHAQREAMTAPPEAPPADHGVEEAAVRRAEGDRDAAQGIIDQAKLDVEKARKAWEKAAKKARGKIDDVKDSGDLNDSTWDKVADVLSKIADIAGMVAAVAGVLALAVGWIPVIGQALAAVFGTIALIAGAISLVCNLALAIGGKGSWTSVILDAVSLATFGIGRAVMGGAKAAYRGSQALARVNAGRLAAQSPAIRVAAGLPGGSSASAIRSMLGGNSAIANLSRNQARNLVNGARNVPGFSFTAPFRGAWDDMASFGSNAMTGFSPSNIRQAINLSPDALRGIRDSGSMTEALARLSGNADALAHVDFADGINAAVRSGDLFGRATTLTGVQFGAWGVAGGLDSYQMATSDTWGDMFNQTPVDGLNLPDHGAAIR